MQKRNRRVATEEAVASDSSKVSSRLQKNHCLATLGAAINLFSKDSLKILHLDGLQAAGRHNDIFLALDLQTQSSTIPPIKVAILGFRTVNFVPGRNGFW